MSVDSDYRLLARYIRRDLRWRIRTVNVVKVWGEEFADTNGGTVGRVRHVFMGDHLRGRKKLFVLLHEAGHIISYKLHFDFPGWRAMYLNVKDGTYRTNPNRRAETNNETQAYLLGTALAKRLGIRLPAKAWREFNWQAKL